MKKTKIYMSGVLAGVVLLLALHIGIAQENIEVTTDAVEVINQQDKSVIRDAPLYHFPDEAHIDDWNDPEAWVEGGAQSCSFGMRPCQIDLSEFNGTLDDFLNQFTDLNDMSSSGKVEWKN